MQPSQSPKLVPYFAVHVAKGLIRFLVEALGGVPTFERQESDSMLSHAGVRIPAGP